MRRCKQRKGNEVLSPNKASENLPYRILRNLPIGLTTEEKLLDLQGIQLSHIGFVGIPGKHHHVGDLTDFQTAALLLVKGHPIGVVSTHLQSLLYARGLGAVVAGFVELDDGIRVRAGTI